MTETKMLQLVLDRISALDINMSKGFANMDINFQKVNERVDKLGSSLAYLEDDAPTMKDHRKLERRVTLLERRISTN